MKSAIPLFLAAVLFAASVFPFSAASASVTVQARFSNVSTISCEITASGSTLTGKSRIVGLSGTTSVSSTMVLQRRSASSAYSDVKMWSDSGTSLALTPSHSYAVSGGYYYRIKVTAVVVRSGASETVTEYSQDCYI